MMVPFGSLTWMSGLVAEVASRLGTSVDLRKCPVHPVSAMVLTMVVEEDKDGEREGGPSEVWVSISLLLLCVTTTFDMVLPGSPRLQALLSGLVGGW
jgi:hypothetical protein